MSEAPLPTAAAVAAPSAQSVLADLDRAKTQRFHLRTVFIAGMGFLTDSYDLFVISLVIPILGALYSGGSLPLATRGILGASALLGAAVGQVFFGLLGDRFGRRTVFVLTLGVMAVGAVGSALSVPVAGFSAVDVLIAWRFILGFGVGGDYPLSATITSEFSNVGSRGRLIATVFAMQGFGLLLGAVVMLGSVYLIPSLDLAWRFVLGFGAVPALATIYFRTRLRETPRFSLARGRMQEAATTVQQLTGKKVERTDDLPPVRISMRRILRTYGLLVFGTASAWFLLDMAFYSTNILNPSILQNIGFLNAANLNLAGRVRALALGNVLIALLASVPGYWVAVALIDRLGRKPLQYIGFGVMAASFLVLAFAYSALVQVIPIFLLVYGVTFFFANFGPNTTTFVYPSEVFPTFFRSTGHGISAAAGKVGAVVAVLYFSYIVSTSLPLMMGLLALFCFLGFVLTLALLPETSQRSLEDVSGEDELALVVRRFSTYLRSLTLTVQRGALALRDLLEDPSADRDAQVERLRQIEHTADEEVHRIYIELNNRRLSSEVRTEVGHLASALDDIMDGIEAVASRVKTYRLREGSPELTRWAAIVVACVDGVAEGIIALDELYRGNTERLEHSIVLVNQLENEADDLLRELLTRLFERTDAVEILKWKDFYERLEVITDRCEDVTDVFQDLQVRYGPEA